MKKLFTFWRRSDGPHSASSGQLFRPWVAPQVQPGYSLCDRDLRTLHKAAALGDLDKVKEYLLLRKHDVNAPDRKYRTPLHLACAFGCSNVVSFLIEKQCKINVFDSENKSPLIKAVQCKNETCASMLLDQGADPNIMDLDGNTALHYAVYGQSVKLVKKLLEYEVNLEAQNKDGCTPLLLAVTENNAEIVKFLLKRGADANASDQNQRTALMIALSDEPTNLVSLLLQKEVDLSCQDIYGFTAEEYASFNGFTIYHHLIANYGKKKVKKISYKGTTLDTTFDTELEEVPELPDGMLEVSYLGNEVKVTVTDFLLLQPSNEHAKALVSSSCLEADMLTANTAYTTHYPVEMN
ncbi:Ankyrin repeat domain-containing protein 7 [Myotis davidii]|uniref:Ankyrin repeat domain-containing protein 7 n=1 Tax=Myotis davidii TaxID=225400 RepID=L5LWF0_MYODS|nr:Ankyrin repeat domain-containing protein 7 [Myotis davidii]